MKAIDIYRAQFEQENDWYDGKWTKHHWVARKVFDLTTYDDDLDERFVNDILEVCKVILEKKNYEYIEDEANYVKYTLVCQLLDRLHWLDWGTSIRGAWFYVDHNPGRRSKDILEELEWAEVDFDKISTTERKIPLVPFTVDNLKALIKFMEE